jgi:transcriptional regulator with PAS, ATPase and Fis domain
MFFTRTSGFFRPRLKGSKAIKTDIMVICATNCDLLKMVEDGKFRRDLYYRLNVLNISIPPLRERKMDIPALAEYFIMEIIQKEGGIDK